MGHTDSRQGHRRPSRLKVRQFIEELLDQGYLLQIASTHEDVPWICTVCFARDGDLNLYWLSRHDARHSRELGRNPRVAGAVAPGYKLGDRSRGLQMSGEVLEVTSEPELSVGLDAMRRRYEVTDDRSNKLRQQIIAGSADFGLYRLTPDVITLQDSVNYPDSPRNRYKV